MQPDSSSWRISKSYDYLDDLPIEGLAWECLRRNKDYQHDCALLLSDTGALTHNDDAIPRRWGLRFRGQTEPQHSDRTCHLVAGH